MGNEKYLQRAREQLKEANQLDSDLSDCSRAELEAQIRNLRVQNKALEMELEDERRANGRSNGISRPDFDTLFENVHDALFLIDVCRSEDGDLTFHILRLNAAHQRMTGLSGEQVSGQTIADVFDSDTTAHLREKYTACVERQCPIEYEEELVFPEEEGIWETRLTPLKKNGKVEMLLGATRNITDERATIRERNFFEKVVEASGHMVLVTNEDGHIQYVNDTFVEVTGYSRAEVRGEDPNILNSGTHDEAFFRDLWETITSGEIWRGEIVNQRKDGELFDADQTIAPVEDDQGEIQGYVAIQQNITDRKQMERELQEKSRAIDETPMGIVMCDVREEDNPISYANQGFQRLTGYEEEEILGRNCRFLQGEKTKEKNVRKIREAIEQREPVTVELRNYRKDGSMFWNRLTISPVFNHDDELRHLLGFQQDITQEKEKERALKLFRETMQRNPDSVYVIDPENARFIDVNQTAVEKLGYSREELLDMRVHDLDVRIGEEVDWGNHREKVKQEGPLTLETIQECRDGTTIPVEVHVDYFRIQDKPRMVATARDITEWKQAQERIRQQAEFLQAVNDQMPGVSYQFKRDSDGTYSFPYISKGYKELAGITAEEAEANFETSFKYLHPDDYERILSAIEQTAEEGTKWHEEFRYKLPDGEVKWVSTSAVPREQEDGSIVWNGVLMDVTELKRKKEKLKQQADFLHTVNDQMPGVSYRFKRNSDGEYSFSYLSKGYQELSGITAEEARNSFEASVKYVHPDDFDLLMDSIEVSAENLTVWDQEFRYNLPGEEVKWVSGSSVPQKQDDGSIVWSGVLIDITRLKRTEEQLRENERRFRTMYQEAPVGLWEEDWSGIKRYIEELQRHGVEELRRYFEQHPEKLREAIHEVEICMVNDTVLDITGASSREELMGNFDDIILSEDTVECVLNEIIAMKNGTYTRSSEMKIYTREGEERVVSRVLSVVDGHEDTWARIFVSYEDITERRVAIQSLKESRQREKRFRQLAETVGVVFWMYDYNREEYVYLSPFCSHLFGIDREEIIHGNRSIYDNVHSDERREVRQIYDQHIQEAKDVKYRVNVDGEWKWVNDRVYPMGNEGQDNGLLIAGIAEEITEQVEQEQQLRKQVQEIQRVNQLKSDFVARTTHDLRTPLNSILGLLDLLYDTDLTEDQRRKLQIIENASRSMTLLTNDILDLDRIEEGKLELIKKGFDIRSLLRRTLSMFSVKVRQKDVELISSVDEEIPERLIGDPNRLQQILNNLVGNALKFTESGYVEVRIIPQVREEDRVQLQFDVEDTGPGISGEEQEKIFQDREHGTGSPMTQNEGAGLGLAITQHLVALMGGEITVDSEPGEGATFSFFIELGIQTDRPMTKEEQKEHIRGSRVLIVDDSAAIRNVLTTYLQEYDVEAKCVQSGEEALQLLREGSRQPIFDVIILDHQLSRCSGGDVIREIGNLKNGFSCERVYILSGDPEEVVRQQLPEVSLAGFLQKPISESELVRAIRRVIDRFTPESEPLQHQMSELELFSDTSSSSVLIVDDDVEARMILQEYLQTKMDQTDLARSGEEGVRKRFKDDPDLVLMDLEMYGTGGLEAVRKIRAREAEEDRYHVPIIIQTAKAMKQVKQMCLDVGADAFLQKPYSRERVYLTIKQVLESRNES